MVNRMTEAGEGVRTNKQKAMRDEGILRGLWNEIYFRNQSRIMEALQWGAKDRTKVEAEFATIPFEEILEKAQKEAA